MLHNEARKLLIQAWDKTHNAKEIAKYYSVDISTVYRLVKRRDQTGSYETRTHQRGRKPALSQDQKQAIINLVQEQPDITINEIIDQLHLKVSDETVRRTLIKAGYTYKKKSLHATEQERLDVQNRRKQWTEDITGYNAENLVFLDESGINIDMTRRYGRSLSNERTVDNAPLNTPTTTTILSSIRVNGEMAYTTYTGGTTAERFRDYLETVLLPTLDENSVIVMDNMRSHHAKEVTSFLDARGVQYLYLPPYSPDLNPIEKLWSKLKSILRKLKVRTLEELPTAVAAAFHSICYLRLSRLFSLFRLMR